MHLPIQDTLSIIALEAITRAGAVLGLVSTQSWSLVISDSLVRGSITVWLAVTRPGLQDTQAVRTPSEIKS